MQNREYIGRRWTRETSLDTDLTPEQDDDPSFMDKESLAQASSSGAENAPPPLCCCTNSAELALEENEACLCTDETTETSSDCCCPEDLTSIDGFLAGVKKHRFTITAMAFQDAMTLDIERLRQCSLHTYHEGILTPFCARYLTPMEI